MPSAWTRLAARLAGIALGVAVAVCSAVAEEPPGRSIEYNGDALTVRLTKVPVTDVLQEIGVKTGAEIRGYVREPRDVSAQFENLPLPEALARLLGTQNFALVYGQDGRLRAVKLLGAAPADSGPGLVSAPPAAPAAAPVNPGALVSLMDQHLPVPVSGRVAQVLGSETASLRQLFELGLHNEDAIVRREAMHQSLQVLETEPELRASFIGTLNGMSDNDLTQFIRGVAGPRAEELAQHLASQSRVSELRVKAQTVLRQLKSGG